MSKTIFFYWTEESREFVEFRYVGGGAYDPVFETVTKERRLRYAENTPARRKQAHEYLKEFQVDHPDARIRILEDN